MLDDVTAAALRLAPSAACEGVFRAFRPAAGVAWVALPAWNKLQSLDTAVMLQVADTAALTVMPTVASTRGPALLVVDRADVAPAAEHFYVVAKAASKLLLGAGGKPLPEKLALVDGGSLPPGAVVCGRLVLVVRPPVDAAAAPKNLPPGLRDLGIADDDGDDGTGADDGNNPYTLGSEPSILEDD